MPPFELHVPVLCCDRRIYVMYNLASDEKSQLLTTVYKS